MRGYLLDTNICIFLLKNRYGVQERIRQAGCENCFVSDVTLAELYYGAYNSNQREKHLEGVLYLEELFNVLPIHETVEVFGEVKAKLSREGMLIDDFDLLIGCTALAYDLVMVSENVRHLARIPGIRVENWVTRV